MPFKKTALFGVFYLTLVILFIYSTESIVKAQNGLKLKSDTLTQTVLIHPVIDTDKDNLDLWSREHEYQSGLGQWDQLARDFIVAGVTEDGIIGPYRRGTGGKNNEDWFGWRRDVLAPFDGTVTRIQLPDSTNTPGIKNPDGRPGGIFFKSGDVSVIYGHVREIQVQEGQQVDAGKVVAKVGNNANSTAPHVHVGAWKNGTPLQIQVVLHAHKELQTKKND